MKTSRKGVDLITKYEGFSSTVYLCPAGYETIGYGHQTFGKPFSEISIEQARELLATDLIEREDNLNKLNLDLNQNQFDAVISFIYNLGFGVFLKSTMYKLLKSREHSLAAKEFIKYVYSKGKKLAGLIKRRQSEQSLFRGVNE